MSMNGPRRLCEPFFAQSALYVQFGRKGWLNWVGGWGCEWLIGSLQSNWVAGWVTDIVFHFRNSNLGLRPSNYRDDELTQVAVCVGGGINFVTR